MVEEFRWGRDLIGGFSPVQIGEMMTVETELERAIAEVMRVRGPQGLIYEQLKLAQALVDELDRCTR